MVIQLKFAGKLPQKSDTIVICDQLSSLKSLSAEHLAFLEQQQKELDKEWIPLFKDGRWVIVLIHKKEESVPKTYEKMRKLAFQVAQHLNDQKVDEIYLDAESLNDQDKLKPFIESLLLSNYRFLKHFSKVKDKQKSWLKSICIVNSKLSDADLDELSKVAEATYWARDLVNEPLSALNAEALAGRIKEKLSPLGVKVDVFTKKKIEALKMGGLLAVNKGSIDPPTFTIAEWKPEGAINKQPIVLVGKGVVYDTGGMSLKPSNYMDTMKCDMSGSAAVAAALYAIAANHLPLHVIALIPATDNRPDGNAYVPGDVITISDGSTVEVLNTDAEGRLIMADALVYAKKYNPELVMDIATLTGAAARAIGSVGLVGMHVNAGEAYQQLQQAGWACYERIVEFPMWDEYRDMLKSDVADLKNIGGADAGAITAAKFLEHFTDYPYIHLDIAGPAFIKDKDGYRGVGATGVGTRLFYTYAKLRAEAAK